MAGEAQIVNPKIQATGIVDLAGMLIELKDEELFDQIQDWWVKHLPKIPEQSKK